MGTVNVFIETTEGCILVHYRLIHTYHAVPIPHPCRAPTMPLWKRFLKAMAQHDRGAARARHGMCKLTSAVSRRAVGDVPNFGFFRLQRRRSRRVLTRMLLPFGMCLNVLMAMETADCKAYELNLRFKVNLSSVVMLRLHWVFFF